MALILGVDLGGTNCRAAVADSSGKILAEATEPSVRSADGGKSLITQFSRLMRRAADRAGQKPVVSAVGVAVPGFVDTEHGVISVLPNLFGSARDIPFRRMLEDYFNAPAWIENDVKTAALGEVSRGWGREYPTFVFIGMGTGTSAALIIDGQLNRGRSGQAAEIGFIVTGREYLGEDFGEHGCLETHASGYGIAHQYRLRMQSPVETNTKKIFAAAESGDPVARQVIQEALDHVSIGVIAAVVLLDPDAIVLGSGIGSRPDVLQGIEQRVRQALPLFHPAIVASRLGDKGQLVGAIEQARGLVETQKQTLQA